MFPDIESENRCFASLKGESWLAVDMISSSLLWTTSQAQPEPKRVAAACAKSFFKVFFAAEGFSDGFCTGPFEVAARQDR